MANPKAAAMANDNPQRRVRRRGDPGDKDQSNDRQGEACVNIDTPLWILLGKKVADKFPKLPQDDTVMFGHLLSLNGFRLASKYDWKNLDSDVQSAVVLAISEKNTYGYEFSRMLPGALYPGVCCTCW